MLRSDVRLGLVLKGRPSQSGFLEDSILATESTNLMGIKAECEGDYPANQAPRPSLRVI